MYLLDAATAYEYSIAKRDGALGSEISDKIAKAISEAISSGDLNTLFSDNLEYEYEWEEKEFIDEYKEQQKLLENNGYSVTLEHYNEYHSGQNCYDADIYLTISWEE